MRRFATCVIGTLSCASFGLALGLVSLARGSAAAEQMVFTGSATVISEYTTTLSQGESITIETVSVSAGGDPVLHLLDVSGQEVAVDDNGGPGSAARLTYRASKSGTYRVVVCSRSASSPGTTDLLKNGAVWRSGISFGGWQTDVKGVYSTPLQTVRLPGGGGPVHELYVLKPDGFGIARRVVGNDVAGQVTLAHFASGRVLVGVAVGGTPGPVRLVHNDIGLDGHDLDNDGLGSQLEEAIGTCSSSSDITPQLRCSDIADARDTDGDGIIDSLEELGGTNGSDPLPLPLWGADPLHKDLFVEVDFMRRTMAENDENATVTMPASVARAFAAAYGDAQTTDSLLRLYHARLLGNPDGKPGISVHLDTGRAPEKPEDATIYGDWGGFNAVDAIQDDDGTWKGVAANAAWKTAMRPGRRGVFRYALAYGSDGGQSRPGFAASYNLNDRYIAAHETGHTMGLGHAGPYGLSPDVNCKPNYPSLMNYAYQTGIVPMAFSDGRTESAPSLNNWALEESRAVNPLATSFLTVLREVFGYYVDAVQGNVDWNRDGVFAPVGHPVQAYANYRLGGAGCEYTRFGQSRVAKGANPVPPALARLGGRTYVFYVRDKRLRYSTSDSKWDCPKATDDSCANASWTDRGSVGLGRDTVGVDAAHFGPDQLLVVASDTDGGLWERSYRSQGPVGNWARIQGPVARGQPALAAVGDQVWLVYRDAGSEYRYRIRTTAGWQSSHFVMDLNGAAVRASRNTKFSPAAIYTPSGWPGATSGIYFLLADQAQDRLELWKWVVQSQRFENTGLIEERSGVRPGPVAGRPGIAVARNRLYIVYSDAVTQRATLLMSYVKIGTATNQSTTKTPLVGLQGYFDNVWRTIAGGDLMYDINVDSNVRAVLVHTNDKDSGREVWFRPKADGIEDYTYRNYDDWEVLRIGLCREVVNPGGLVSGPIKCLSKAP